MDKSFISKIFLIFLLAFLIGAFIYNADEISSKDELDISFSAKGGLYDESFYLELKASPKVDIYYTLDGSIPTTASKKYEGPLLISDASLNENNFCLNTDISAGFDLEYIRENCPDVNPGYKIPSEKIEKCTVVRAVAVEKHNADNMGDVKTQCYFVGFQNKEGFQNVYMVCINGDYAEFFSDERGILVLGDAFERYRNSEKWDNERVIRGGSWENFDGNFREDLQASINVECFDYQGKELLNEEAFAKVKGNTSVSYAQKSLKIELSDNKHKLFSDNKLNSFCIEACGQDGISFMRDKIVNDLCKNEDYLTRNYIPCCLFLNGEYWGYYYLAEKYDKNYFKSYFDVDKKDLIVIKNSMLSDGVEEDYSLYYSLYTFITNNDMSDEVNYKYVCEEMDINSFIDFYATEFYVANGDFSDYLNNMLWRTRSSYSDRWQYMLFDLNTDSMNSEKNAEAIDIDERSQMLSSLLKNAEFRKAFTDKLYKLSDETFSYENISAYIDDYKEQHLDNLIANRRRFYGNEESERAAEKEVILADLNDIQNFYAGRREYINNFIEYINSNY